MKKRLISLPVSLLLLTMLVLPAGAAAVDLADPDAMLPVDIIIDQDAKEIRKVYDLSPNTDPSTLPMAPFERDGLQYECTDVLREVVIGSETQTITQTETVDSSKKDMETILGLLPQDKEERCIWCWIPSKRSLRAIAVRPSRSPPHAAIRTYLAQIPTICPRRSPTVAGH